MTDNLGGICKLIHLCFDRAHSVYDEVTLS
jgi:hypothetical protein